LFVSLTNPIYFNPQSDVLIKLFVYTSKFCEYGFYMLCNMITIGMKNEELRYALILSSISMSVINVILCMYIIHEYYDSSTDKLVFEPIKTWILQYNIIFSALTFFTGIYALYNGGKDVYVIENGNYYNLCFDITVIHLGFIFLGYFLRDFLKLKILHYKVTWIKSIVTISYIIPFMWLFVGEIYVFGKKPFIFWYRIIALCVFVTTCYYILLLIRLMSEMTFYSTEFDLEQLNYYKNEISIRIFLSTLLLIIPLHITLS